MWQSDDSISPGLEQGEECMSTQQRDGVVMHRLQYLDDKELQTSGEMSCQTHL